jgi:hypothetical protein
VSNRRTPGTWAGKPLRLSHARPSPARALPRARVPQAGQATVTRGQRADGGRPDEAGQMPVRVPAALLAPLRIRRAPSSRSGSGP